MQKICLKQFFTNYGELMPLVVVAIGFFLFTSFFNYKSQDQVFVKWLSPDETANYTISRVYAQTGSLEFFEKYNLVSQDLIHPRSFRSDWGWIKPVSFIGLPLFYGFLGRLFGVEVLPYLTPLIGACGIIIFYLWIRRLFGRETALLSATLLACFPVYIYFSARSFFHNILFIVASLAGLYFGSLMLGRTKGEGGIVTLAGEKKEAWTRPNSQPIWKREGWQWLWSFLSGACFALAISARSSELLWLGPLLVALFLFNLRSLSFSKLIFFLAGLFIAFFPIGYWNQVLYGSWYASGYPELNSSLNSLGVSSNELAATAANGKFFALVPLFEKIKATIFHFGFRPGQSKRMFQEYVINMFPWLAWSLLAAIFVFIAWIKSYTKGRWLFFVSWIGISGLLIIYYGSWIFFDNPDRGSFTIGNSYTRYWLPFYIGALPLISFALVKLSSLLRYRWAFWTVRILAVLAVAIVSLNFVWTDKSEGLRVSIEKQKMAKVEWTRLLALTEPNAVIITRYHDKLLFPERKVIIGQFDDKNMIKIYGALAARLPVYYYNFSFKDEDVVYLNSSSLMEAGIRLEKVERITKDFTLYRLYPEKIPTAADKK